MFIAQLIFFLLKYADKPVLQFQCQVTLCLKLDGGCSGISPPRCPETKPRHLNELQTISRRRSKSKVVKKSRRSNPETMDVFTKPVMVKLKFFEIFLKKIIILKIGRFIAANILWPYKIVNLIISMNSYILNVPKCSFLTPLKISSFLVRYLRKWKCRIFR